MNIVYYIFQVVCSFRVSYEHFGYISCIFRLKDQKKGITDRSRQKKERNREKRKERRKKTEKKDRSKARYNERPAELRPLALLRGRGY
jgi:hypothetical protein